MNWTDLKNRETNWNCPPQNITTGNYYVAKSMFLSVFSQPLFFVRAK